MAKGGDRLPFELPVQLDAVPWHRGAWSKASTMRRDWDRPEAGLRLDELSTGSRESDGVQDTTFRDGLNGLYPSWNQPHDR